MPANRVTSKSPWHVIFVIDDSGSMFDQPAKDVNLALKGYFAEMAAASGGVRPYFKVSIIAFGSSSSVLCEAKDENYVNNNISQFTCFQGERGGTNAASALDDAANLILRNGGCSSDFEPFVFFLSDGAPDSQTLALEAANKLKNVTVTAGRVHVWSIGIGSSVDDSFMKSVASTPERYIKLTTAKDLVKTLPDIGTVVAVGGGAEGLNAQIKAQSSANIANI